MALEPSSHSIAYDDKKPAIEVRFEAADDSSTGHAQSGTLIDEDGLQRRLKTRHVTLISISSIVGASVFYGFGYALQASGPLGALIGFGVIGFVIWALMQSVGEVTTMFPVQGGFIEHASRFVDPAFSFAMSWLYYLMWGTFLGSEWNGQIMILRYWVSEESMPMWSWVLVFLTVFSIMTTVGVNIYGEMEFWLGWFKLISLGVCFFISLLVNVGAFGNGYIGFRYWTPPQGPIINGIQGFGVVFVLATTYCIGTEIISLAAGETQDPRKAIPSGVNTVVWRVLFVYIGVVFFQGIICPSDSPGLVSATSKAASSPFTIAFTNAGWKSSGHFVNAIITVAFISAANGCIYVQGRSLYAMAKAGRAPKIFTTVNKKGVPYVAILFSCCWGLLALMNMRITAGQLFSYFVSVCGTAGYIAWAAIVFTHLRVRAGLKKQGIDESTFPFRVAGSIWIYRFNFCLCIFLLLINGFQSLENPFNWRDFIAAYVTIPTFAVLYFGYKFWYGTKWVGTSEMDFSGRLERLPEDGNQKASLIRRLLLRFSIEP